MGAKKLSGNKVFYIDKYKYIYCSACGYIIDSFKRIPKKINENFCCGCGSELDWSEIYKNKLTKIKEQ